MVRVVHEHECVGACAQVSSSASVQKPAISARLASSYYNQSSHLHLTILGLQVHPATPGLFSMGTWDPDLGPCAMPILYVA